MEKRDRTRNPNFDSYNFSFHLLHRELDMGERGKSVAILDKKSVQFKKEQLLKKNLKFPASSTGRL
jgi:hypothetical protein